MLYGRSEPKYLFRSSMRRPLAPRSCWKGLVICVVLRARKKSFAFAKIV